jgi:hypothetical protein
MAMNSPVAISSAALEAVEMPPLVFKRTMRICGWLSYCFKTVSVPLAVDPSSARQSSQCGYTWARTDSMQARSHCGSVLKIGVITLIRGWYASVPTRAAI